MSNSGLVNFGLWRLFCVMVKTRDKIMSKEGFSLTDEAMKRDENKDMLQGLMIEVALEGEYTVFINSYANELLESIESLVNGEHWDEADIAAAEAIPELNDQLLWVKKEDKK